MGKSKEIFTQMREKSLFLINEEQQNLMFQIEEMGGELTPEMEAKLEITKKELNQKSIAYLEVISQKNSLNRIIDIEIKRLQALKERNSKITLSLKENLLNAVKTFGSYEIGLQKFGSRKSESIEVEFINELPERFKTIKVTETANKIELKKALKSGEKIKGVVLKSNLNLKIN